MDDRVVLNRKQDKLNLTVDLFRIVFDRLFSELNKIMVNKVTFTGFRGSNLLPGSTPVSLCLKPQKFCFSFHHITCKFLLIITELKMHH